MTRSRFHSRAALLCVAASLAAMACLQGTVRAATVLDVKPILSVSEMFDDNILFTPSDSKSDFVTSALLGAYVDATSPTSATQFEYNTLGQKYADHSRYDSFGSAHYFRLGHQERLSPATSITVSDHFLRQNLTAGFGAGGSLAFNPSLGQATLQGTNTWSNAFSFGLAHSLGERLSSNFSLQQTTFHTGGFGYSMQQGGDAGLGYSMLPTVTAGFRYQFRDYRFTTGERPGESHLPQASIQWRPTSRMLASAYAGPAIVHTFGGATTVKPGYQVSVSYAGERWVVRVGGGETPSLTAGLGGAGESQGGSGSFTYRLGQYTSLMADASYQEYSGGGFNGDVYGYGAGVTSQLNRWLSVYVQYQGYRRALNSGAAAVSQSTGLPVGTGGVRNLYMIGASVSFDLLKRAI